MSFNNIENGYYKYLLEVFEDAELNPDSEVAEQIEAQIDYIYSKAQHLHELSREAKAENDAIKAGNVLKQLNTPYAKPSSRVTLFTAITFVAVNIMMMILLPVLWLFKKHVEDYIRDNYLMY